MNKWKEIYIGEYDEENHVMIEIIKQEIRGKMNEPIPNNKECNLRTNEQSNGKIKRKGKEERTKSDNAIRC